MRLGFNSANPLSDRIKDGEAIDDYSSHDGTVKNEETVSLPLASKS